MYVCVYIFINICIYMCAYNTHQRMSRDPMTSGCASGMKLRWYTHFCVSWQKTLWHAALHVAYVCVCVCNYRRAFLMLG